MRARSIAMTHQNRTSVYERITAEVIAAIEKGAGEYRAPWHHDGSAVFRPANVVSGKPYRGVNVLALWAASETRGYATGQWGTFRQWTERGAQVSKGERASLVVFWKASGADRSEDGAADEGEREEGKRRFFARGYSVFNVGQVDGYEPEAQPALSDTERHAHADGFIASLGVAIEHGGDSAYYRPSTDTVHLPCFSQFRDAASYYGVALHELGHASGARHRLGRDLTGRFGTRSYAAEETCVDLAAGFVLADLGIAHHPRPDHAAYLSSWMALKEDSRAIFTAASKAQAIADWMHSQQSVRAEADQWPNQAFGLTIR
jgi:antirestriction protein ArdC